MLQIINTKNGRFMVFNNDFIGQKLFTDGDWEPHFFKVLKFLVKEGDICIDCGANLGYHTIGMSMAVGNLGFVYAFEPQRIIYQQLCGNIFINDKKNIYAYNLGLSNNNISKRMRPINYSGYNINIGSIGIASDSENSKGEEVSTSRLDDFIFEKVNFIKIDIQGYEEFMLIGADQTLKKFRPFIFIELEDLHLVQAGSSSEKVMNHLLQLDYLVLRIKTSYPSDHLAIPREKKSIIEDLISSINYPVDIIDAKTVKLHMIDNIFYDTYEIIE